MNDPTGIGPMIARLLSMLKGAGGSNPMRQPGYPGRSAVPRGLGPEPPPVAPNYDMGLRLRGPEGGPLAPRPGSSVVNSLMRRPGVQPSVASVGQRGVEAMPPAVPPSVASVGQRAIEAMPPALETDAGPSINEPAIPAEPTGDADIYKYALTQPDLLDQAASGRMTSSELLVELLRRRQAQPSGGLELAGPR